MSFHDLALDWEGDLEVNARGGLKLTTGLDLLKQRIIRRIFTNKKEVLFTPDFGAGVPMYVQAGITPTVFGEIKQRVLQEVYKEEAVVRNPAPEINIQFTHNSILIYIRVWTIDSKQLALQLEVER